MGARFTHRGCDGTDDDVAKPEGIADYAVPALPADWPHEGLARTALSCRLSMDLLCQEMQDAWCAALTHSMMSMTDEFYSKSVLRHFVKGSKKGASAIS